MSMQHKAYAFDHAAYDRELRPILEHALRTGKTAGLRAFIVEHASRLVDPYEGDPLAVDWEERLEAKDVHEYGDYALTRYYDPKQDIGLGELWSELEDLPAILGRPIGDEGMYFDPGRMGSYVQSADDVAANAAMLRHHTRAADLLHLLESAPKGLYVTF